MTEALLEVRDLVKHFPVTRGVLRGKQIGTVKAVDGLSFSIQPGETFAIVGESGCGKTTLANLILSLMPPTRGDILLRGQPISRLSPEALMLYRKSITAVFQDPYGARQQVLSQPSHPYTAALLQSIPQLGEPRERLPSIAGEPPDLGRLPAGCPFHPRCDVALDGCRTGEPPPVFTLAQGRQVRCWLREQEHDRSAAGSP